MDEKLLQVYKTNLHHQAPPHTKALRNHPESSPLMAAMSNSETLPQEIIIDILSRLPVKSLCRFKSVCHSWKTIISDPHFAKTHLNRTNKTNKSKYLVEKNIIISNEQNLYSIDFTHVNPTTTKLDFPAMQQRHAAYTWQLWSSCDGLLLVSHGDYSNFFLLNPSTRECKKLPTPALVLNPVDGLHSYIYGFGYDSFADDYKIVSLYHYDPMDEDGIDLVPDITVMGVYSLKTNRWRRIQDSPYKFFGTTRGTSCGVIINGNLHFVGRRIGSYSYLIVAFNLTDEIFREVVPLPASFGQDDVFNYRMEVLGGCLCLVYQWHKTSEFWMMKEYGVIESWSKFTIDMCEMPRAQVLCLLEEDEFLVQIKKMKRDTLYDDKFVVYNSKEEAKRDMEVCGLPTKFTFGSSYVGSLISPNHGGGIGME